MPSPRTVAGVGTDRSGSRLAAAAGPPRHRLTLNSTHRTQSQNTATNATHGHGLLRLGHRHRLPLPAQIKHLRRGGGDERPAVAVRARVAGDGSPIERTRSCCSRVGAARRASHPQTPRRTPSRGRGRAAGTARVRREARGGVGGGGGAGGGGHGAGARGWWRARHPRALRGRRSDSHACGQRRRVVRRAASRRARSARGRRALVGDSSPSEERGAGASRDARSSNRQVTQEKRRILADSRKYAVSSVRVRRTPTPSASNWPRYLPRKLVGGGGSGVAVGAT